MTRAWRLAAEVREAEGDENTHIGDRIRWW